MGLCDSQKQAELICLTGQRIRNFFWGTITRRMDTAKKNKKRALPSPAQLQLLDIVIAHDRISITELAKKMMYLLHQHRSWLIIWLIADGYTENVVFKTGEKLC